MNLVKQYIVQAIVTASNNLRLSSEKIEVVAILREHLSKCSSIENEIIEMKKITTLSKFAIKLDEVYRFIATSKIDFLKISDRFKEHSHSLIRDLCNVLDVVTPQNMRSILAEISNKTINVKLVDKQNKTLNIDGIKIHQPKKELIEPEITITEKLVLEDIKEDEEIDFEDYEKAIMKPVKELDSFFKKLESLTYTGEEIKKYHELMEANTKLSEKVGFEIITNMHKIISHALSMIRENELAPIRDTIESMRACLIVIVAVVRRKDVDITTYLNKAEKFGKNIYARKGRY
ncbi:hypothetical protein ASZ90_004055 [hydrocarbon metagenome]|uniref:Uncharacterized protein n=1 Tax=hydrocarbon metagenome TaxID=938273 RepID=A0A0W8FYV4_9ZZZZ